MIEEVLTIIHIVARINIKAVRCLVDGTEAGTTDPRFRIDPFCNKGGIRNACKSSGDPFPAAQGVVADTHGANKGHPRIQLVYQLAINPDNQSLCPIALDEHI